MQVSFIVPCYNEEENIQEFWNQTESVMRGYDLEVIFVNDGSRDDTEKKLKKLTETSNGNIKVINFSRNFGKEAALYAGLSKSKGDIAVIIDADLQQPIEKAKEMIDFLAANREYDQVAAYQKERIEGRTTSFFKKMFYGIINRLSDVKLYKDASDFRAVRRNVIDAILNMPEYHRFSKGIFAWVGFETYYMPYEVRERFAGTTKWSFFKLLSYAVDGIVSFSTKPLKAATTLGLTVSFLSIAYMIFVFIQKFAFGIDVPGYPTLVTLILFLGGIQLVVLGIIGEYLSRIHIEVKHRPIYIEKSMYETRQEKTSDDNI